MQVLNAGIAAATHNVLVALIVAAVFVGVSSFAQHLGNQTIPPAAAAALDLKAEFDKRDSKG
jgi:hypothetical protein